jgi:hypothetical protein
MRRRIGRSGAEALTEIPRQGEWAAGLVQVTAISASLQCALPTKSIVVRITLPPIKTVSFGSLPTMGNNSGACPVHHSLHPFQSKSLPSRCVSRISSAPWRESPQPGVRSASQWKLASFHSSCVIFQVEHNPAPRLRFHHRSIRRRVARTLNTVRECISGHADLK